MSDSAKQGNIVAVDEDDLGIWEDKPATRKQPQPAILVANYDSDSDNENDFDKKSKSTIPSKMVDHNLPSLTEKIIALPSVAAAFDTVHERPKFLDPDALRPHATTFASQNLPASAKEENISWDISKMAPKLKGSSVTEQAAGVVSALAVRYKEGQPRSTKAIPIEDFIEKGTGAQLPRKRQDTKDKEKAKRQKGQSSHQTWKSEAEMALRQQFD